MDKKIEIINRGVESKEYFSIEAINSSTIKKFMDACKKMPDELYLTAINGEFGLIETFFEKKEVFSKNTELNFAVGEVIHKLCLEEKKFDEQTKFTNFEDFFNDIYKKNTYSVSYLCEMHKDVIKRCYQSWCEEKIQFDNAKIELAYFSEYESMPLKAKIDLVGTKDDKVIVVDLKTISSFSRINENIKNYYYWFQTLYYKLLLGYWENDQYIDIVDDLYLIFVSKTEYGVRIVKFSELDDNVKKIELENFKKYVELFRKYYLWKKNLRSTSL